MARDFGRAPSEWIDGLTASEALTFDYHCWQATADLNTSNIIALLKALLKTALAMAGRR